MKLRKYALVLVLILMLFLRPLAAQYNYCVTLFDNSGNIVTNAFAASSGTSNQGVSIFAQMLGDCMLIIFMVLTALSIVYGIGVGFKIDKLVNFVKTEYFESVVNILIVIIIAGGISTLTGASEFISSIPAIGSSGQGTHPTTIRGFYTDICSNIFYDEILPSVATIVWGVVTFFLYNILSAVEVSGNFGSFATEGIASYLLPNVTISPWIGIKPFETLVYIQIPFLVTFIFLGITMIFLFYTIFFLFPVFLYVGIALRSFPWTRAAGGALVSLFISFYIIFPALFYPFTLNGPGSDLFTCPYSNVAKCNIPSILSDIKTTVSSLGSSINPAAIGENFIIADQLYAEIVAYVSIEFIGLGIAFVISYDLLDSLCDILGAPSMHAERIFTRLI